MKKKSAMFYAAFAETPSEMAPGTWTTNPRYITFGRYNGHDLRWRVLEVYGDKTAFLALDDVLRKPASDGGGAVIMHFDVTSNTFPGSSIGEWLKNTFLPALLESLGTDDENCIRDTTYGPDNIWEYKWDMGSGPAEATSKIFLLSAEEAVNPDYFFDGDSYSTFEEGYNVNADRSVADSIKPDGYEYWLRSPDRNASDAAFVGSGGDVSRHSSVSDAAYAVRPAFKINLSSPAFTSALVSYLPLVVKVEDGHGNPIPGAKVSLFSNDPTRNAEKFLPFSGVIYFTDKEIQDGEYNLTVSKPGCETGSQSITVPMAEPLTITLPPDTTVLKQDTVTFGKYDGNPITWRVLDTTARGADKYALLLADKPIFNEKFDTDSDTWNGSDLQIMLNGTDTGGFLHSGNFTDGERGAVAATTIDGTEYKVFLLSQEEALRWMPDKATRKTGSEWWLRTGLGTNAALTVNDEGIALCIVGGNNSRGVRPAMWVKLPYEFTYPPALK